MAAALSPTPALAQPVFRDERDWTLLVGGRPVGLRQTLQLPGGARETQVWVGLGSFEVRGSVWQAVALLVASPGDVVTRIDWTSFRRLR